MKCTKCGLEIKKAISYYGSKMRLCEYCSDEYKIKLSEMNIRQDREKAELIEKYEGVK